MRCCASARAGALAFPHMMGATPAHQPTTLPFIPRSSDSTVTPALSPPSPPPAPPSSTPTPVPELNIPPGATEWSGGLKWGFFPRSSLHVAVSRAQLGDRLRQALP